ncbi:helix-turn-helix transcriptional regulator [Xylanibacter rodentium]|jgi:AraC-like DNA-binding protein|uniref:Helix-turn-helix transcriptional regulator n=1 Tax=Xylanibacter rodentium TaxID=2736289 RepID=A0ABX2ASE4_9BACT|nr:helix-turn-helix transcriptional regulator [Xylanibacter rodentium]NPE11288.1 helix-turn-helix transcriptional regulator [Prevotella sp. PJ1A]NPE13555.1 helix-turn-helix transcriptional regulator [Xylanibacter rodentium]NPE38281.1 helix-turn-helix transcriptional regulator [Prevotella sp. PCJ2]
MNLRVIKPCADLQSYVRYYWVLKSPEQFNILTFPIGCPQMIFHRLTPLFIPELSSLQDRFTISGQVNFPAHITSDGDTEMIVAVFYPHTIGMFIDIPPSEFYNSEISGFDIGNKNLNVLARQIFDCETTVGCIKVIENWLLSRLNQCQDLLNMKRSGNAVNILMATPSVSVNELADISCLSPKQFGRVFNSHLGMMPKEYARVVRFQKSMWMLQNGKCDYAAIAYLCGYSDQSHFIRDFRQYSSVTPARIVNPYSDLFTTPT